MHLHSFMLGEDSPSFPLYTTWGYEGSKEQVLKHRSEVFVLVLIKWTVI